MNGMPSSRQISFSSPAVSSASWRDSTTQGPAMRNRGCFKPDFEAAELHAAATAGFACSAWCAIAASTKLLKSGWPARGVEVNSGWNWQPTNHG